uniref:serpin family protein n=1 Tax=Actinotalea sp. TaxID=1872145 RepID=UPI003567830E
MTQSRRRHPGRLLIGVASACLLGLSACGSTAPAVERRGEAAPVTLGTMTASDVGAAQQSFGLDLLHAVCMQRPGENLLLSPTSAAEALALLYPAAAGSTSDELGALLHLPAWSPDLVAAMAAHTRALTDLAQDGPTEGPDAPD